MDENPLFLKSKVKVMESAAAESHERFYSELIMGPQFGRELA
jgi:hypothetical protein